MPFASSASCAGDTLSCVTSGTEAPNSRARFPADQCGGQGIRDPGRKREEGGSVQPAAPVPALPGTWPQTVPGGCRWGGRCEGESVPEPLCPWGLCPRPPPALAGARQCRNGVQGGPPARFPPLLLKPPDPMLPAVPPPASSVDHPVLLHRLQGPCILPSSTPPSRPLSPGPEGLHGDPPVTSSLGDPVLSPSAVPSCGRLSTSPSTVQHLPVGVWLSGLHSPSSSS